MVFDVGSLHGRVWIAMEYVAGETLEDWLASDLRSWAEIVGVLAEAGRGLAAVHSAGLVHRDFKPGNLIVRKDGMVQVLDFGLAVRVGDEEEQRPAAPPDLDALAANLTTTGAFMGTPAYMAPEQFMMRPTDGRADQFSLCVALYEALYGHRPFKGRDMADLMSHTLEGLSGLPPEMPGLPLSVRQVIARGLARNPDDRFADMNALVEALEQTRAPPRPSSGGWRRFGLGMIAGIAVLAVGVGVWLAQEDDGAPAIVTPPAAASEPAPSDDTRRKKPTPPPMPSEPDPAEEAPPTPAAVPDVPPQAEPEVDANEDAEPDPEPAKAEPHPPSLPKPRDDPQLPIDDRTGLPSVHDREEPEDPVPEDRKPPPAEVEPVQPDDPPADDRE
jgi:serine/threonine protein kinase